MRDANYDGWYNLNSATCTFDLNVILPKGLRLRFRKNGSALVPSVYGGFYY